VSIGNVAAQELRRELPLIALLGDFADAPASGGLGGAE